MFRVATIVVVMFASAAASTPVFEAASVKVAEDPNGITFTKGGPETDSPTEWTGTNWSLTLLITRAWHLAPSQLIGPSSLEDARYDITARLPPRATADDFNLMLQALLTERIGLVLDHETRQQPAFEMTISKGGLKLKEAAPLKDGEKARAFSSNTPAGGYRLFAAYPFFGHRQMVGKDSSTAPSSTVPV